MYNRVTFAKTFGVSLGVLLLVAAVGIYGGVAYAVPVSGVGTYEVAADEIHADEVVVHPQVDESGETVAVIELQETEIEGLEISKEVNGHEVVVSADQTVESDAMLIRADSLDAEQSGLEGVEIDGNPGVDSAMTVSTGADLQDGETVQFDDTSGDDLHLEDFEIDTNYLVTNEISIPGLSLELNSPDEDGNDEG